MIQLPDSAVVRSFGEAQVLLQPKDSADVGKHLGFEGRMIFDWAFEGSKLRVLNTGCDSGPWLRELFQRDRIPMKVLWE